MNRKAWQAIQIVVFLYRPCGPDIFSTWLQGALKGNGIQ
jgi:hypothetical protein